VAAVPLAALALGVAGCGSKTGTGNEVTGTIKFDGKPAAFGTITFTAGDGSGAPVSSTIDEAGHYDIPNLKEGAYKVSVEAGGPRSNPKDPPPTKIPPRYAKPATSGLTYTVTSGKQTKDFDLTP